MAKTPWERSGTAGIQNSTKRSGAPAMGYEAIDAVNKPEAVVEVIENDSIRSAGDPELVMVMVVKPEVEEEEVVVDTIEVDAAIESAFSIAEPIDIVVNVADEVNLVSSINSAPDV
jgi:hypothetical protein